MANKKLWLVTLVVSLAFAMVLVGCDNDQNTASGTPPVSNPDPKTLSPALRAVPTAASTASPVVLDSYTDGTKNYYLIDVGYVKNTFVSTILEAAYNGMTPISVSKTTISTRAITEALTETISESITVSDTQSGKVGIETSWKKKFLFVGEFSAKLNVEWAGSWTNSKNSSKSTETSVSKTESLAEQYTTSVTIGEHGEPAGNYRYALYATSDIYFIISTSLDNDKLLSWETVVCARDSSYTPHWDYSPDGIFDNSPDAGKEITFAEDFYKSLPKPVNTEPSVNTPTTIETDFKTIRTGTFWIRGRVYNQDRDVVNFDVFDIKLNKLKQDGYKTVSFFIQLNVREVSKNGSGNSLSIHLYSSPDISDNYRLSTLSFPHSASGVDGRWWVHYESELKFENISLDKFQNNEFVIRYSCQEPYWDWENKDLKIQLVIKK